MRASLFALTAVVISGLVGNGAAQPPWFSELPSQHLPFMPGDASSLASGDVDGDGDLDLVVGVADTPSREQTHLYLNDGGGVFVDVTPTHLPVPNSATNAVELADLDGDGALDLILAGDDRGSQIYRNDGSGVFTDVTAAWGRPGAYANQEALAVADLDGDGDLDLVTGNNSEVGGFLVSLQLNDGTGRLTSVQLTHMPLLLTRTQAIATGDVDGDGDLDLILGNRTGVQGGPQNLLYLNDGQAVFTDATALRLPPDPYETRALALADVDGDNDLDLVTGNISEVGYHWGTTSPQNQLYLNDGLGFFALATAGRLPLENDETSAAELVDLDGDGDLDLLFGNQRGLSVANGLNRLYLNDGVGVFSSAPIPANHDHTTGLAVGDFDGDGDPDAAFSNSDEQVELYLNDGRAGMANATPFRVPRDATWRLDLPTLADVDGDGDLDLLIAGWAATDGEPPHLYLNDGFGFFAPSNGITSTPVDTEAVAWSDVDGDGDLDLVLANLGQDSLLLNNGTGSFADVTATHMPSNSDWHSGVASGDVDGDGDADLIFASYLSGTLNRLYLNDGSGGFTDFTATHLPPSVGTARVVALGDVDGDGDLDLAFGFGSNTSGLHTNELYLNDGGGHFFDVSATHMPSVAFSNVYEIAFGDMDGDGDLDMVVADDALLFPRVFDNDGTGRFTFGAYLPSSMPARDIRNLVLADVDENGTLDILLGGKRAVQLVTNNGSGLLTRVYGAVGPYERHWGPIAVGDIDFDGDPDVLSGDETYQRRAVINLRHQVDAPLLARLGRRYRLDVYGEGGYAPPLLAAPFASTALASPRIPIPPFGLFGLGPVGVLTWPGISLAPGTGFGALEFTIPNNPSSIGQTLYTQAVVLHGPTPFAWRLTNVNASTALR